MDPSFTVPADLDYCLWKKCNITNTKWKVIIRLLEKYIIRKIIRKILFLLLEKWLFRLKSYNKTKILKLTLLKHYKTKTQKKNPVCKSETLL